MDKGLDKGRMRVEQVRTAQFPFALATVSRRNMVLDGKVAWNVNDDGSPSSRLTDKTALDRRMEMLHHPVTILRAALGPGAKLSGFRTTGNLQLVDIAPANGDMPTLARVCDRCRRQRRRFGRAAAITAELAAPANPPVEVTAEQGAPGIWWLAGSGNNRSVVFEFADHLTLFELPESEARAKAVIEKARSLGFGKPLTEVIVSYRTNSGKTFPRSRSNSSLSTMSLC